jgi:hypothetical protein
MAAIAMTAMSPLHPATNLWKRTKIRSPLTKKTTMMRLKKDSKHSGTVEAPKKASTNRLGDLFDPYPKKSAKNLGNKLVTKMPATTVHLEVPSDGRLAWLSEFVDP